MQKLGLRVVFSCLLFAGCAGSNCRAPVGNASLTPSSVAVTGGHTGEPTRWGGILVEARNLREATELEVVGFPLDGCGRPRTDAAPTGRFIIVRPGFLETTDYRAGLQVSATGRIKGVREGSVGDADYRFPILESYKVDLWSESQTQSSNPRPWVSIGVGGGSGGIYGGMGGGVGVLF